MLRLRAQWGACTRPLPWFLHTARQELWKGFAMIKDLWFPVHFQLWIQIAQLKVTSQSTLMCGVLSICILTLNPFIKAVCLLEDNCEQPTSNRKFSQTDGSQTIRETTVIMDSMHLRFSTIKIYWTFEVHLTSNFGFPCPSALNCENSSRLLKSADPFFPRL